MENTVKARVVRIGNSRGIRIPRTWLKQLGFEEEVEMAVRKDGLLVRRKRRPREGWAEAFRPTPGSGEGVLLDESFANEWDQDEWEW